MAMVAGGGGGIAKPTYDTYSGIGGNVGFNIEQWRKEQEAEKKRKEQEARAKADAEMRARQLTNAKLRQLDIRPTNDVNAPSRLFKDRAQEAKASLGIGGNMSMSKTASGPIDDIRKDPIMRYSKLVRDIGKDAAGERLAAITDMWNAYNRPYSGSKVIAELLFSPYTLDEIHSMIQGARHVLFDSGRGRMSRQMDIDDFAVDLRNKYRVSGALWDAMSQVFVAQEQSEIPTDPVTGFLIMSSFIPGLGQLGWAAKGVNAALNLAKFGGKMLPAMAAIGDLAQMDEAKRMAVANYQALKTDMDLQAAADPLKMNGMAMMHSFSNPSPFQQAQELRKSLAEANKNPENREDIIAYQKMWQANGIGTDLEANGILDYNWQSLIIDASQEVIRATFEEQRLAIEEGDAPYWAEVNGDINDPQWKTWMAKRQARLAENERLYQENPDRYAWFDQAGIPMTKAGWEAFGRKLDRMGHLQAVYGSLLQVAMTAGKVWQATGSAINLSVRQKSDPEYQRRLKNLLAYVDGLEHTPDFYKGKPTKATEGYARLQIDGGALANDAEAKRLLSELDQRQIQLIQDRYDPDYLLTMGYALGGDFAEVRQFGLDHPDVVRAFTTGIDIVTAKMNPVGKVYRATVKPKVAPKVEAFVNSTRAKQITGRIATYLFDKDAGRAQSYIKGTGARTALNTLYRFVGKKQQTLDPRSKIVTDLAREVVDAVDDGQPARVAQILDGTPDAVVNEIVKAASGPSKTGLTRAEQRAWVGAQYERGIVEKRVASAIARRQSKSNDAISKKVLTERLTQGLAVEYAKGADIFPYLRDNRLSPPNRGLQFLTKHIGEMENPWVRSLLTRYTVGQVHRAPTAQLEFNDLNTLDRVMDAAMLISQDSAWAWNFRNRWASAKSEMQLVKLAKELDAKFTQKFNSGRAADTPGFGARWSQAMGRAEEPGGQALAPDPTVVPGAAAGDARLLTEYGRGLNTKQAVPDTVYQRYMFSLHRSALWAPYKMPDAGALAKGMTGAKNIYRLFLGTAHRASTPLRQWTVAMGAPMLFQKHAITDSFRTVMEEGPFSLLEAFGLKGMTVRGRTLVPQVRSHIRKRVDSILEQISPTLRDEIMYAKARSHSSEAQWLSGTSRQVYRPKTIRDADNRIIDLDGAANALRRITQGEAFKAYASGGEWAVMEWLQTSAGKQFLREGGWYDRVKTILEEDGKKYKSTRMDAIVREEYMDTIVAKEFARLDTALPNIMPELKRIALNDRALDVNYIKKLIEDNPTDNAVISMPAYEFGSTSMAGYIVGKAMSANKWNRDVVFDHVFANQYRKLAKEGIEPDTAARAAATIAELNTSRIHFDLSNALAIEARHRWLAWFATKHRLYGTYVAKLAIERPMIAGAAMEIAAWMEERNQRLGVGEFDKYDLVINIGDGQYRFNLAPIMWFSEYPLESSAMIAIEKGGYFLAKNVAGLDVPDALRPSPTPFGMTFTRADALIITIADVVKGDGVDTPEKLQEFLNALPAERRTRWNRLINRQRAISISEGKEVDSVTAFHKVRASAIKTEFFKAFKFYSGRKLDGKELEIERLLNEFAEISKDDPEKGREMMRSNRVLAAGLNAAMDPVEKEQLDYSFRIFNQYLSDYEMEIERADSNGTLIYEYRDINQRFRDNIDKLTNPLYAGTTYDPVFAKYYGDHNPQEFLDALGILMPLVPSDSVWREGRIKSDQERREEEARLRANPEFQDLLKNYKLTDADKGTWLYKMIEEEYVDIPLAEFTGENPYDLVPYAAQNVARYMARGGESGPYKAQAFEELVGNQTVLKWMGAGIGSNGKASASEPMMGSLSALKQDAIGWNVNPETRQAWFEVAKMKWALELWRRSAIDPETGKMPTTSSKLYTDTVKANMTPLVDKLKRSVPGFENEWNFSQLPMHERLLAFGVGQGESEIDKGMGKFLNLTSQMWDEFNSYQDGNKTGITSGAGAAGPIVQKYMKKVGDLALENKRWWYAFHSAFSLSKFGYNTTWKLTDPKYLFLWENDPAEATAEEDEDYYWAGD